MAEIIKLGKARKARAKADASQQAAENRVRHGRTKAARAAERLVADQRRALLDSVERENR